MTPDPPRAREAAAPPHEPIVRAADVLQRQHEQLRQAQRSLEASHDRYAQLYERAPVGYLTVNRSGLVLQANRQAGQLLEASAAMLRGRHLFEHVLPEDHAQLQQRLVQALEGQDTRPFELQLRARPQPRRVTVQISLMHRSEGGAQCLLALCDVTDRARLEEGTARLAAIVASSEDAIVSRDLGGRVTSWNDAAGRLFGRVPAEMLGRSMDGLVPRDRLDEERQLQQTLQAGCQVSHHETERLAADGRRVPVSISLSPIRSAEGRVVGSAMIARDISERQRADEAMRVRLGQLDVLAEAGQALILGEDAPTVHDELFERVAAAVGCEMLFSFELDDPPAAATLRLRHARGVTEDQRTQLASMAPAQRLCSQVAASGRALVLNALQRCDMPQAGWLKAAGARSFAGFPLRARGRVRGVVSFASRSRDELPEGDLLVIRTVCAQVAAMLERSELTDELHANERSLKRADRAKDDFIAMLAHELRNPLAPIRNAAALIRRPERLPAQQLAWCAAVIERQLAQMTHLLEGLLDVSRVTRNKIELRRERMDLRQAVAQAIEATRPLSDARGLQMAAALPDSPLFVDGDLTRLTQACSNLLDNAAKYTELGGRIDVTLRREGSKVRVTVRDDGIGIEPGQLAHVFDMFAQLGSPKERWGGGLGIGLALTRVLVELHGGSVHARSDGPGRGSEFVVELPATQALPTGAADDSADAPPADEARPVLAARRVLVVDDNVDAAQTLAALLTLHGQEVRTAYAGEPALALAKAWAPEVAVLDIGLPDLDGHELCRRVLAHAATLGRRPLVVACTGWGQHDDVVRAREAGFDAHLVKPVNPDALLRLLAAGGQDAPHRPPPPDTAPG